jgi:hypothetical protein
LNGLNLKENTGLEIIAVFGLTISGKGTQSRQHLAFSRCAAQGNSLSGKKAQ